MLNMNMNMNYSYLSASPTHAFATGQLVATVMIRGQISYTTSGSDPSQPPVPPLSTTAARYSSDRALHSLPSELEIVNPCRAPMSCALWSAKPYWSAMPSRAKPYWSTVNLENFATIFNFCFDTLCSPWFTSPQNREESSKNFLSQRSSMDAVIAFKGTLTNANQMKVRISN